MWQKFVKSFHDSEVILFNRLQVFVGVLAAIAIPVLQVVFSVDMSTLFSRPEYVIAWAIFAGLVNEWLRRRRSGWGEDKDDAPVDHPTPGPADTEHTS